MCVLYLITVNRWITEQRNIHQVTIFINNLAVPHKYIENLSNREFHKKQNIAWALEKLKLIVKKICIKHIEIKACFIF